jgi:hypothetical protein
LHQLAFSPAVYEGSFFPTSSPTQIVGGVYFKVHLETQETMNSQGNTQQKEQCWRYHDTRLQTIFTKQHNKNSMVLAQKQI